MFQTIVVQKTKTHIIFRTCFRKSCLIWDNVEEHGGVRQAIDGSIIRRMHIAWSIT